MKYVHTNIVARDWRKLSRFYQEVFGCTPVPPERDLSGDWLDRATGLVRARIEGIHLRLPGHGDAGPTLEIFQYHDQPEILETSPNRPGLGHLAFAVEDVEAVKVAVLEAGGGGGGGRDSRGRWDRVRLPQRPRREHRRGSANASAVIMKRLSSECPLE